jgi:hypothetical protein
MRFAEILDVVEEMPLEDQAELVAIVRRRLIERGREELAREVQEARSDFQAGRCSPRTTAGILRDILS